MILHLGVHKSDHLCNARQNGKLCLKRVMDSKQKTVELHPDIVLLDVSMPGLNGIEAASRIRQLSPDSRIIILTQDADDDLMTAALQAGALAYVLKAEMTTELIPAVQAALRTSY